MRNSENLIIQKIIFPISLLSDDNDDFLRTNVNHHKSYKNDCVIRCWSSFINTNHSTTSDRSRSISRFTPEYATNNARSVDSMQVDLNPSAQLISSDRQATPEESHQSGQGRITFAVVAKELFQNAKTWWIKYVNSILIMNKHRIYWPSLSGLCRNICNFILFNEERTKINYEFLKPKKNDQSSFTVLNLSFSSVVKRF